VVRAIVCLLGLLLTHSVMALQITATVDKNPVIANESFILEVVADDDVNTNALDTSVLMKDFIVGRTSVSSQTNMINFKTTRTTRWSTVLIARKPGTYVIPALTVEGTKSAPITLEVLSASDSSMGRQQDIFITTDVSAKEVYVQQQLTLTVKLHFAAELKRGSLSEPILENANISQIGKDQETDSIINGRRFRVIERTYAISPQQSGDLILKPPVFSGEIMVQSRRHSNFLSFGETKPVSVVGDEIPLTVRPIPASYQGQWLPSELLTLHQEWQPEKSAFKVGEPITRTITLTAAGLSEEQLPSLQMSMPPGLKIYPDQAELHTGINSTRLVSQKVQNFAIVASRPGTYQLPEMTIPWWNTVTNKYQQAIIPGEEIVIQAGAEASQTGLVPPPSIGQSLQPAPATVIVKETSWLQWLFLALWLLTSLAWMLSAYRNKAPSAKQRRESRPVNDAYLALMSACKQHQGEQALSLLVPWANGLAFTQKVNTLDDALRQISDEAFSLAVNKLQRSYYGKSTQEWQGNELLVAIQGINKSQNAAATAEGISLNP